MQFPADPRVYPKQVDAPFTVLIGAAQASLAASSRGQAAAIDADTIDAMVALLRSGQPSAADLLAQATSPEIARYLWRRLIDAWQVASSERSGALTVTLFAVPIVIVAALDAGAGNAEAELQIEGVLGDKDRLAAILREHRALGDSETIAMSSALVATESIDVPRLNALLKWQDNALEHGAVLDLPPAPVTLRAKQEGVHLRYLCGSSLSARRPDLPPDATAARWGMAFAQDLARQLAVPGASVLTLPRPPQLPVLALQQGRAAQREVALQLFASNAIRSLRSSVGEPSAVISAHRCRSAPGGGELRLSLSSPFEPKEAEGFRCPIFVGERAGDIGAMLIDLMRDCRISDVHVVGGVHADRDPDTGLAMLFKPDALPDPDSGLLH
jgi:hypothetical protein